MRQSAAVQTFLDKLPDAYAIANKLDVFMDYKEVHLHAICECIKAFLIINPKNWAPRRGARQTIESCCGTLREYVRRGHRALLQRPQSHAG